MPESLEIKERRISSSTTKLLDMHLIDKSTSASNGEL